MENVSHNTSYSEASPNVHNEDEELDDSEFNPINASYHPSQHQMESPITQLKTRIIQLQTLFKISD
jgi:hypothetical protein